MAWLASHSYREAITIDNTNVDGDLSEFPIRVKITARSDLAAVALANGHDVRFTESDGQTLLKYEREKWSVSGGALTAEVWVKVTAITSASPTTIYMYVGDPDAADGEDATNVWDGNFVAVYHLNNLLDSSGNGNTLTGYGDVGSPTGGQTGQIGDCYLFDDADNQYLKCDFAGISVAPLTMSAWFKSDLAGEQAICWIGDKDVTSDWWALLADRAGVSKWSAILCVDGLFERTRSSNQWLINTWHYAATRIVSATERNIYLDAAGEVTGTDSLTPDNIDALAIGRTGDFSPDRPFSGYIDEVRVSDIVRSVVWLKFEYYNMGSANQEITWGGLERTPRAAPDTLIYVPWDGATLSDSAKIEYVYLDADIPAGVGLKLGGATSHEDELDTGRVLDNYVSAISGDGEQTIGDWTIRLGTNNTWFKSNSLTYEQRSNIWQLFQTLLTGDKPHLSAALDAVYAEGDDFEFVWHTEIIYPYTSVPRIGHWKLAALDAGTMASFIGFYLSPSFQVYAAYWNDAGGAGVSGASNVLVRNTDYWIKCSYSSSTITVQIFDDAELTSQVGGDLTVSTAGQTITGLDRSGYREHATLNNKWMGLRFKYFKDNKVEFSRYGDDSPTATSVSVAIAGNLNPTEAEFVILENGIRVNDINSLVTFRYKLDGGAWSSALTPTEYKAEGTLSPTASFQFEATLISNGKQEVILHDCCIGSLTPAAAGAGGGAIITGKSGPIIRGVT